MENISNFIKGFAEFYNPTLVNWSNPGNAVIFILKVALLLVILFALGYLIRNFKKIISNLSFFRDSVLELRKVDWLSRKNTYKFSLITFLVIVLSTLFIFLTDQSFLLIRKLILFQKI